MQSRSNQKAKSSATQVHGVYSEEVHHIGGRLGGPILISRKLHGQTRKHSQEAMSSLQLFCLLSDTPGLVSRDKTHSSLFPNVLLCQFEMLLIP